jgi:hypothetical protein
LAASCAPRWLLLWARQARPRSRCCHPPAARPVRAGPSWKTRACRLPAALFLLCV